MPSAGSKARLNDTWRSHRTRIEHAGLGNQLGEPRVVMVNSGLLAAIVGKVMFATSRAARALDEQADGY